MFHHANLDLASSELLFSGSHVKCENVKKKKEIKAHMPKRKIIKIICDMCQLFNF